MYKVAINTAFGESIYTDMYIQELANDTERAFDAVHAIFDEYTLESLSPENMEAMLFGEAQTTQEAPKGFVEKLGAAIRTLITEIGKFIEKIGTHFMSGEAQARKAQEELEKELVGNPDLKKKVMQLSAEGAINLRDMKDIAQLSEEVDKLMEEKNPKTLKGKFEKLKKEWSNPEGKFLKTVAAGAAVAGLVLTCYKVSEQVRNSRKDSEEVSKKQQKALRELGEQIRNNKMDAEQISNHQMKVAMQQWLQGQNAEAMQTLAYNSNQAKKGFGIASKLCKKFKIDKNPNMATRAVKNVIFDEKRAKDQLAKDKTDAILKGKIDIDVKKALKDYEDIKTGGGTK